MEREFWEKAKKALITEAPPEVKLKTSSGGKIDASLVASPFSNDFISWDDIDMDAAFKAAVEGKNFTEEDVTKKEPQSEETKPVKRLDTERFDQYMEQGDIPSFIEASKLLMECDLPESMNALYVKLLERLPVLNDAIDKFKGVYEPNMVQFYEYYIPEALQLTATYLEYQAIDISEDIIENSKSDVMNATNTLLVAVDDKIDEIYKYASIELQAKAKALETLMGQDGYVNPSNRIN